MSIAATMSAIARDLAEAVQQARAAYEFAPGSYTHSTLTACLSARNAFDAYRDTVLEDDAA